MSVLNVIDGASASKFTKVTGTGDSGDPFVPSVNVEVVIPGTNATDLGKAEDAPHVSGDTGVLVLAVRNDAGSTLAGTTGDYIPLGTDSSGNLRVTSGGGGLSANVAGDVAHDAVDSGDPVKVGGYAKATAPTAVSADGDRVNAWFDLAGRLAVHDGAGNLSIDDGGNNISIDDGGNVISVDDGAGSLTVDGSVTVTQATAANLKVDPSGVTSPVKVTIVQGAANIVTAQVTAGSAGTLVVARPTRRAVTIKNSDSTNGAYVGPATVTSANGLLLAAGESITLTWVGLIQCLAAAGSPVIMVADEYD